MKKEGMHYLAYSLTLDPEEEIKGAIEDVKSNEPKSLDNVVNEESTGLEAAVEDAQVVYRGNDASYRSDAVELPENYKDSRYKSADDDESGQEVSYSFGTDPAMREAAVEYDKEVDGIIRAKILKTRYEEHHVSAEAAERAANYKLIIGKSMSFLLFAIKSATV
ncbi:MAG: hypothetical protein QXK08_03345 [Candidatus Woesearchaeota archaeon]